MWLYQLAVATLVIETHVASPRNLDVYNHNIHDIMHDKRNLAMNLAYE